MWLLQFRLEIFPIMAVSRIMFYLIIATLTLKIPMPWEVNADRLDGEIK